MPIYEYRCRACMYEFERLVRNSGIPECPACHSGDVERLLSAFGVSSDGRSRSNLQRARKDFTQSKSRQEAMRQERQDVHEHVQEHYGLRVPPTESKD